MSFFCFYRGAYFVCIILIAPSKNGINGKYEFPANINNFFIFSKIFLHIRISVNKEMDPEGIKI